MYSRPAGAAEATAETVPSPETFTIRAGGIASAETFVGGLLALVDDAIRQQTVGARSNTGSRKFWNGAPTRHARR